MKLSGVNDWLSLSANIGVLAGIFILVLEINQNTSIQRVSAAQQVLGISATTNNSLYVASLAAEQNGNSAFDPSSPDYPLLALSVFANHWQVYYQYQEGFLDREIFEAYERRTEALLASTGILEWWQESKFRFSDSYVDYVDGLIEKNRLRD